MNVKVKFNGEINFTCPDHWSELDVYQTAEERIQDVKPEDITSFKYESKIIKHNYPLIRLPIGARFYVINGAWYGEIRESYGKKHISTIGAKRPWKDLSEDPNYRLDIILLKDDFLLKQEA